MLYSYLQCQSLPGWPPAWHRGRRRWAGWSPKRQSLVRAGQSLVRKEKSSGRRSWGRRIRRRSFLRERRQVHPAAEAAGMSWHEMDRWPRRPDHHWHHRRRLLLLQLEGGTGLEYKQWMVKLSDHLALTRYILILCITFTIHVNPSSLEARV